MKFTLSWLKKHLDTTASLSEITDKLTAIGLEVEAVADPGKALAPFVIGHVVSAEKHPNADKLKVAQVDIGSGDLIQVVCGAPNCRTGLKVVFASPGATVPATGDVLKIGKIREVESRGMLCSERELLLSEEHNGILELPEDAPVGTGFAAWHGLDDAIIEINLTPNRADCAGVYGIARDLAAAGLGILKPLDTAPVAGTYPSPIEVTITASDKCPLFIGRHFRGVKNGPSPEWLQTQLRAVGLRPISALVDITNWFCLGFARPLHVFDAAKIKGHLCVRNGVDGETLAALNDREYTLNAGMCVIADSAQALALGGIIGGESSAVDENTTEVFLEVALFTPQVIASAGRSLGIISDARYRFERGVDTGFAHDAMAMASRMILELCGGEASELVVAGAVPETRKQVTLRHHRVKTLGGIDIPVERQTEILTTLGFKLDGERVSVPSWRGDIHGETDLVEEILRIHGYDALPLTPLPRMETIAQPAVSPHQRRIAGTRRMLTARGLDEVVTWSFTSQNQAQQFGGGDDMLRLVNPISVDLETLRPSILGNLVTALTRNAARGFADGALFEIGPIFKQAGGQEQGIAGVRAGTMQRRDWQHTAQNVDVFAAKADALATLESLGVNSNAIQISASGADWFHPGQVGTLKLGQNVIGQFGTLHPALLEAHGSDVPMVGFEIYPDRLPPVKKKAGAARPLLKLSLLQPVKRDFAFVVAQDVAAETLLKAARTADKTLITEVNLFDVYQGEHMQAGKKSLAIAVTLQPVEKTLQEADLEAVSNAIIAAVQKATGAVLRC